MTFVEKRFVDVADVEVDVRDVRAVRVELALTITPTVVVGAR